MRFGFGQRAGHGRGFHRRVLLNECASGECGTVVDNTAMRALEMGFYPGVAIEVLSNRGGDSPLVVLAGESRFVVPPDIARTVVVRRRRLGGGWRRGWRWGITGWGA